MGSFYRLNLLTNNFDVGNIRLLQTAQFYLIRDFFSTFKGFLCQNPPNPEKIIGLVVEFLRCISSHYQIEIFVTRPRDPNDTRSKRV